MNGWACRLEHCPEDTGAIRHTATHGQAVTTTPGEPECHV